MKQILLLLLISTNLSAQTIPQDKMLHFSGCYIVSATTTTLASYHLPRKKAFWLGVSVGTALGLAKEIWDINNGTPEVKDLGADILGSIAGSITVTIRF
jgi:uncharacterized protein YfiM (DUF2279 family)